MVPEFLIPPFFQGNEQQEHRIEITPELADKIWAIRGQNRILSPARIDELAEARRAGRWEDDIPKPILFGRDGKFANGFTRIASFRQTRLPTWVRVMVNASEGQILSIDSISRSQSTANTLTMMGRQNRDAAIMTQTLTPLFKLEVGNRPLSLNTFEEMSRKFSEEAQGYVFRHLRSNSIFHIASVRAAFLYAYEINPSKNRELGDTILRDRKGGLSGTGRAIERVLGWKLPNRELTRVRIILHALCRHYAGESVVHLTEKVDGYPWAKAERARKHLPVKLVPDTYQVHRDSLR